MDQIVSLQMELHELKQEVEDIVDSTSPLYLKNTVYWDNSDLAPDYSSVPSGTKAKFYLEQAENNGTLDQIQRYHEPLAFTVNAKSTGGLLGGKKWYCKFRVWDASRLSFLSAEGDVKKQSRNHNKFEIWTEDGKSSKTTRFQNKIMDKISNIE